MNGDPLDGSGEADEAEYRASLVDDTVEIAAPIGARIGGQSS